MRTFIIGDVHGMLPELEELVTRLNPRSGDRFAFLGDLVDKGPDSIGVIDFVRALVDRFPDSVVICGNHEESAIRLFDKAQKAGTWDGIRKAEKETWLKAVDSERVEWLRSLPLFARLDPGILLVHGGLLPAYFDKYDALPSASPESWHRGGGKTVDRMRRMLRIRHVYKPGSVSAKGKDITGQMVQLGDEGENTQHWTDWYDGREGFVFFGHDPQKAGRPCLSRHALALDTGAVFGGRLTAAIVDQEEDLEEGRTNFHVSTGDGLIRVRFESVGSRKMADWLEAYEA